MRKLAGLAVAAALSVGLAESRAQFIILRPNTGRQGTGVGIAPGGSGLFGGGLFGGGGTYSPPAGPAPNAPGFGDNYGYTGRNTRGGAQDGESITGHPTRFLSYSHYFQNQGGGGAVASGAQSTQQQGFRGAGGPGVLIGGEYARAPGGAAPPRPPRAPGGSGGGGGGGRR